MEVETDELLRAGEGEGAAAGDEDDGVLAQVDAKLREAEGWAATQPERAARDLAGLFEQLSGLAKDEAERRSREELDGSGGGGGAHGTSGGASYDPATDHPRARKQHETQLPPLPASASASASATTAEAATTAAAPEDATEGARKPTAAHLFERCLLKRVAVLGQLAKADEMVQTLNATRPHFAWMPKAKTAKIVRVVVDTLGKVPGSEKTQVDLCREYIAWCVAEKRSFLKHRIQARLAGLLLQRGENAEALALLRDLQSEIKRLDDKPLLVEVFLLESRAHLALRNNPRAKASLTAARSNANSIYVVPMLQAELDMQSGMLNANDRDFRTAYSYFYEAFEMLATQLDESALALRCLKYMLLSKVMLNQTDDIPAIMNAKAALPFSSSRDVEAMRAMAKAVKARSLDEFDRVKADFPELEGDALVAHHLSELEARLLETNLQRIIEPFSRVEVEHVAKLIRLGPERVEAKLSQMILDKKLNGILEAPLSGASGAGTLVIFDEPEPDATYKASLDVMDRMNDVVDSLFRRAA